MKRTKLALACAVAGLGLATVVDAAPILPGNLVVVRVGTGAAGLNSAATDGFLEEFTTSGTPVQTIALPTADSGGNQILTFSGSATSEGMIQQSGDGNYLTVAGYDAAPATVTPHSSSASVINRVVGRVTIASGAVDTSTALNNAHSGSNIRGAVSSNGTDIWTAGSGSTTAGLAPGVTYTTYGATTATRVNTGIGGGSNRRVVGIYDGRLYVSAFSAPNVSLATMTDALPTTAGQSETVLPGMPTSGTRSTYDFWFANDSTVYLADDGSTANGGGIQKWVESGGTWSLAYTLLNDGSTSTPVRGLTGYVDGLGNAVLFGTQGTASANNLITVTDTGVDIDTATVLATAGTNTAFRGVEYIAPIPEPASLGLIGLAAAFGLRRRKA